MGKFCIFVCLLASAAGLLLKDESFNPQAQCPFSESHEGAEESTGLADDANLESDDANLEGPVKDVSSLKPMGKTVEKSEAAEEELKNVLAMKTYKDARKEFFEKKMALQVAQAKLMAAMDGLLSVPKADQKYLEKAAAGELGKDALIVFYAPWCPHCQTFVLHDAKGNPRNAPYENIRKNMAKDDLTKDVDVVRADVTLIRPALAKLRKTFKIVGIPTAYYISKDGKARKFIGNMHVKSGLRNFVAEQRRLAVAGFVKEQVKDAKAAKENVSPKEAAAAAMKGYAVQAAKVKALDKLKARAIRARVARVMR